MNMPIKTRAMVLAFLVLFPTAHAYAFAADFTGIDGKTVFSEAFIEDFSKAEKETAEQKSVKPMLALLEQYKKPTEQAQLYSTIGLLYNQRTGLVDEAKAVEYLTKALEYEFSDRAYVQLIAWRGNSLETLKRYDEALADYLQGLLVCSYYNVSDGRPEIQDPPMPIYMNSPDPRNDERVRNYRRYRHSIDLIGNLSTMQSALVEAVKRLQNNNNIDAKHVTDTLNALYPDPKKREQVLHLINGENIKPGR